MRNLIIGAVAVVAVIVIGVLGYIYISGGSGEASEPVSAPELTLDDSAGSEDAATEDDGTMDEDSSSEADTDGDADAALDDSPDDTMADDSADVAAADDAERRLYRITQAESEARFTIDEMLRGSPKTVIGTTPDVAGDIIIDFADPTKSEVGPIVINARTLTTDNEFRNRAIRSAILQSAQDEYELITFTPTALTGLPVDGEVGTSYAFAVVGDLQIRDITAPVTFTVSVVVVAPDRVEGSAEAVVNRADFNLVIPEVPSVTDVAEEVPLFLEFVALEVAQ